jgi:antitoxin component YwqK of YwqJK toxin-antitoxin module
VYDRGVKERAWKIYYKTGKIKTKGKYRNGEKVGEWTTFYRDVYYPDDE